jgi:hypothetical protein
MNDQTQIAAQHATVHSGLAPVTTTVVQTLTSEQCRRHDDARWARHDPDVLAKFRGEFVVPYHRTVVAHGHVVAQVLDEAADATGRKPDELPICLIDDPLHDLPH